MQNITKEMVIDALSHFDGNAAFPIGVIYAFYFDPNEDDVTPGKWEEIPRMWKRIE